MGPRNAVLGVADACGHPHWGVGWSSIRGHETLYWARRTHADNPHWGLGWSSLWGHETLYWVRRTHVATPSGALGGAPYGPRNA
eukprot:6520003-Pyramimonas_sp.AAC.1